MNTDPTIHSTDYRVLLARTAGQGLLAATAMSSLIAADLVGAVALGAALVGLCVAVARRELRIRRRLADTAGTRPASGRRPGLRAGPGEDTPTSPDPIRSAAGLAGSDRSVAHDPSMTSTFRGGTP